MSPRLVSPLLWLCLLYLALPAWAQSQPADQAPTPASILRELNWARTQPAQVAEYLARYWRPYYKGTDRLRPGETVTITTNEGVRAVDDAIRFLRSAKPLPPLALNDALNRAASDHLEDMRRKNHTDHEGSDGSTPDARIERYGQWEVTMSENLMFGSANARDIVLDLIVDDGVEDRGHRSNIYDAQAKVVGIAFGPHPEYGTATVMDFAGGMRPRSGR